MTKKQQLVNKNFIEMNKKLILNTSNTILQKINNMLSVIKECSKNLKTETIEVCFHLGIDPKKTDQNVKTAIEIPNGWMSKKQIGLFTPNNPVVENKNITICGLKDIEEIKNTKSSKFDICIAHTSLEKQMNSIAKILQKTSPNKKWKTLTDDCDMTAVKIANNQIKLVSNERNMILTTIGTSNMTAQELLNNLLNIIDIINSFKPVKLKTAMIKRIKLTSTQLPKSIEITMREVSLYRDSNK